MIKARNISRFGDDKGVGSAVGDPCSGTGKKLNVSYTI